MKKQKLYFENEYANIAYDLSFHVEQAKENNFEEIELFEAVIDKSEPDYVWCGEKDTTVERSECNKKYCNYHKCIKGRICDFRGKLYTPGKKIIINVK